MKVGLDNISLDITNRIYNASNVEATIKEMEEQNRVLRDRLQRLEEAATRKLKEDAVHGPEKSN